MADEQNVYAIAMSLPGVTGSDTGFGVDGKGFIWVYNQKIEGQKGRVERRDVLAARVASLEEKDALIAADPEKFFTDDHYRGFPAVLVRLAAIDVAELAELITDAWRIKAPRKMVKEFDTHNVA
jgi:hypothetical protein